MSLASGTRLGGYEIVALLGAGGMGEVYRAQDTKLGRDVALKVLPDALASDSDRIARLQREAKALAALNHPHIATLHALEQDADRHFLVMELVDGDTLADRLERGALSVEHALRVGFQIAEALEAAHEKGVVHRDLKPANVKITPDERIKVLDFGLARLATSEGATTPNLTHSPTLSMMATQAGVILGTAAYMSPEQAKGLPADHRSDVFSFGVVFYEMLTGRQPFQGETAPDIMASVLAREPDLNAIPAGLNPRLLELIKRCLEKNPKKRWQAVGDLRAELEIVAAAPRAATSAAVQAPRSLWRRLAPIAATALATAVLMSAAWFALRPSTPAGRVVRFNVAVPALGSLQSGQQILALSPDGTSLVYIVDRRLNLRSLAGLDVRPLAQADMGSATLSGTPVFSPDAQSIAFWAGASPTIGTFKRVSVAGGAAVTICDASFPFGASWGSAGILFGQQNQGIMRVSPAGGRPEVIIPVKDGMAWGPQLLPDGDSVLFTLATGSSTIPGATADTWDQADIVVQSLKSGRRETLGHGLGARFVPTGHLLYAVKGVLFAAPFDAARLRVTGAAVPVVEGVLRPLFPSAAPGNVQFSVSESGSLAYVPGSATLSQAQNLLAFVDSSGAIETLKLQPAAYEYPRVSPKGTQVAYGIGDGNSVNLWVYDLSGSSSPRQLTFGGRNDYPVWSPDGTRLAFQSNREGDFALFVQQADGSRPAERLTKPDTGVAHVPESWSADGNTLLFDSVKDGRRSLWTLSMRDGATARFAGVESGGATSATFSHDGRWVAYASNADNAGSGTSSVFVRPFPAADALYRIGMGITPVWWTDDKQLSYIGGGQFTTVSITTNPSFAFGNPSRSTLPFIGGGTAPRNHDLAPDGKRILGVMSPGAVPSGAGAAINVVVNWFEELKQRVPAGR